MRVNYKSDCHGLVTSQRRVSYAVDMTTKGQPGRVIRIDDETWADYEKLCEEKCTIAGIAFRAVEIAERGFLHIPDENEDP